MKSRFKMWIYLLFVVLLYILAIDVSANLSARLDRDRIAEGETAQLLVEADGQVLDNEPNTQPLTKDFDILGIVSGSRVNIVNGQVSSRTSWGISLAPKYTGKLIIPPLELNGDKTPALTLQVTEASALAGSDSIDNPIFLETEVDRSNPYVQGMVLYTVRLYLGTQLVEGKLSEPHADNAMVQRIGEDYEYTAERDGHQYRVIERQYAIFPQSSGKIVLHAPVLDARTAEKSSRRRNPVQNFFGRDPFEDMFPISRPLRMRGEVITLDVRPRPDTANNQWLPAEYVEIAEKWQPESDQVSVGDPLTRTITIRARGMAGEQLPDLDMTSVAGFKIYPDQAKANTLAMQRNIEGEKSQRVAYVPTQSGRITLPEINFYWWDTNTDQQRVAQLPARVVDILPASNGQNISIQSAEMAQSLSNSEAGASADISTSMAETHIYSIGSNKVKANYLFNYDNIWLWISMLFALLWLMTLWLWWRNKHGQLHLNMKNAENPVIADNTIYKAHKCFLSACRTNDPRLARRSLLQWAANNWPDNPPSGLDDLAWRLADPRISAALKNLDRVLYCGENQAWDGSALANLITKLPRQNVITDGKKALPDLYAS